jgi:predicted nucleic acid-binding protein
MRARCSARCEKSLIVDTSFLVWKVLPSPRDPAPSPGLVTRIAAQSGWMAPNLIVYETLNVMHRKRRAEFPGTIERRNAVRRGMVGALDLQVLDDTIISMAAEMSETTRCSSYDAVYLALARSTRKALLTADAGIAAHAIALKVPVYLMPNDLPSLERDFSAPKTTR